MQSSTSRQPSRYDQTPRLRVSPPPQGGLKMPPTARARGAARRRRARRRRVTGLLVLTVLLLALLITALLLAGGKRREASVSMPQAVAPTPVVEVNPPALPPEPPQRTATPYDEVSAPPLFNYDHPIPDSYLAGMQLADVGGGQQMEARAGAAFTAMSDAAAHDGVTLAPVSGYRTNQHQSNNYNASIQRYLNQGYSRDKAVELTEGYYAIPGTSEHEAGLAMDIGFIEESFEDTETFTWLQEHCAEYGFIMRYRADTFDTTRIRYEPWHYRYIGANHAEKIRELGFTTLEDYTMHLEQSAQQMG